MSAKVRQKVKDLIELAVDDGGEDMERAAAAMRAVKLIRKYELLDSPLDELLGGGGGETIQATVTIFEAITDPTLRKSVKKIAERFRRGR